MSKHLFNVSCLILMILTVNNVECASSFRPGSILLNYGCMPLLAVTGIAAYEKLALPDKVVETATRYPKAVSRLQQELQILGLTDIGIVGSDTAGNARDVLYTQAEDSAGRYMLQVVRAVDAKTFVRLAGRQGYEYLSTLSFIRGVSTSTVSR